LGHVIRLLICLLCIAPAGIAAESIPSAIDAGTKALLKSIDLHDEIVAMDPARPGETRRYRGRVVKRSSDFIQLEEDNGSKVRILRRDIQHWIPSGMVRPEMEEDHFLGGPSALAALALVNAGVEPGESRLAALLGALAGQDVSKTGTYVRSIRACVWSALIERQVGKVTRAKFKKLLADDVHWLQRAGGNSGLYTYTMGGGGDHSNTQFANLGLWAGGIGGVEISPQSWQIMSRHWLETQSAGGGWSYTSSFDQPTSSMTVAGCNSLYIALDRFYARSDYPYVIFEGARPNKKARQAIGRVYDAIRRGDAFLKAHPSDVNAFYGYELFGLERLGVASGSALIGGKDWFNAYAGRTAERRWGSKPVADAFALIFLVHGRAPIFFQKLEHGKSFEDWNYYHRDLASLCRYLSRTFERIHRWQRVERDAGLEDLQKAPILYISGSDKLELAKTLEENIHQYILEGGTVFLHADRASKAFAKSGEKLFENMFRERDMHFIELPEDHPVYRCHFGTGTTTFKRRIPLRGLSDGSRICVFLCPVDIAGAWHQNRNNLEDLFRIMANIRTYSVPPYGELLEKGRPLSPPQSVVDRGSISVGRLKYPGAWNLHPAGWNRYAVDAMARAGLKVQATTALTEHLDGVDVLYCCVAHDVTLDKKKIEAIKVYLEHGGLLLIDAADGQPEGIAAVGKLFEQIAIGQSGMLETANPIVSGNGIERSRLGDLKTTVTGSGLGRGGAPAVLTRTLKDADGRQRIVVLACPFDLIAGLDGPFIYNRSGYTSTSTRELVDRILLWRWMTLHGGLQ
jgi:hypothetical protein